MSDVEKRPFEGSYLPPKARGSSMHAGHDSLLARCAVCGMTDELRYALIFRMSRPEVAADCVPGRYTKYPQIRILEA